MRIIRLSRVVLPLLVVACGGMPASRGPLFMAAAEPGTSGTEAVSVQVVDNTVTINGRLENGCRPEAGDYVVDGHTIDVHLVNPPTTSCSSDGSSGSFTTRVGPLSPGGYRVTVRVGDQTIVASQAVRIG
jgi:hypothetical protein